MQRRFPVVAGVALMGTLRLICWRTLPECELQRMTEPESVAKMTFESKTIGEAVDFALWRGGCGVEKLQSSFPEEASNAAAQLLKAAKTLPLTSVAGDTAYLTLESLAAQSWFP